MTTAPSLRVDLTHSAKPSNGSMNGSVTPRGEENRVPNGVSILSPQKPNAHRPIDFSDVPPDEIPTEMVDTAEKTNHWASLCFGAAIVFFGLAGYDGYSSFTERSFSLLIRGALWVLVATIIGTVGEILQKTTKGEPLVAPNTDTASPVILKQDQFPGMPNMGNTCFINAPTQAIMNDSEYPRLYKDICEKAKKRHETYNNFLELFQTSFSLSNLFWKKKEAPSELVVENMKDVLLMLMMRSSFEPEQFKSRYPTIHRRIDEFSKITKYADLPDISDQDPELRKEFNSMKDDPMIIEFFKQERTKIANEILGFESYLNLIRGYETAVKDKSVTVSLGGWRASSQIGNVRNLFRNAGGYSQEDVDELLRCLSRYVLLDDYPQVFFPFAYERTWAETPDQDADELERVWQKHQNPKHAGDILTELPSNGKILLKPELESILQIKGFLHANASGQTLVDEMFNSSTKWGDPKTTMIFLDSVTGSPKKYHMVNEKIVIQEDKMPERLILELVRQKWNEEKHQREKITCPVDMPEQIKIKGHEYRLNSVVCHSGTAEGGHYFAVIDKGSQWWYASDSTVTTAEEAHINDALQYGYLYFYKKIVPAEPIKS